MPISSLNDIIAANSLGKTNRYDWQKLTGSASAYTANRWYDMASLAGNPVATAFPGTARAFVNTSDSTGDGTNLFGIPHGGNVSTDVKHLIAASLVSAVASAVPAVVMFVDMVGYWPGIDMNLATSQPLTGTPSLTRYANGAGLRMFLEARATTGATAHNLSYSYTNQAAAAGRVNPVTVACTASAIVPHIVHTGSATNNYGPFLPMASGDTGIQNAASVQLSAASGTVSTAALVLCRPLFTIPIAIAGLATEKDFLNQFPSLPRIPDGACIVPMIFTGAALAGSTVIMGSTETLWG